MKQIPSGRKENEVIYVPSGSQQPRRASLMSSCIVPALVSVFVFLLLAVGVYFFRDQIFPNIVRAANNDTPTITTGGTINNGTPAASVTIDLQANAAGTAQANAAVTIEAMRAAATAQFVADATVQAESARLTAEAINNQSKNDTEAEQTTQAAASRATQTSLALANQGTVTSQDLSKSATETAAARPTEEPTTLPKKLNILQANASSYLNGFPPNLAFDGSINCDRSNTVDGFRCWISAENDLKGAWIEAIFETPRTVVYFKFHDTNIRQGTANFDDGTFQQFSLIDTTNWQLVELTSVRTSRVRIVVDRLWKDEDTQVNLRELEIWGR